jgi:nucleoside-diphosphate-sugar epimerase
MNILIAGGAGYIGSALVPELLDHGYAVKVVDLLWFGNHLPKDVPILQKDIFELIEEDLKGFDQVIFLAGLSNDPMAEFAPGKNFIYNAAAPAYLGYLAKRAGVRRFIYAGSCSVYGYTINELYDETSPAVSHYAYGISKLQGEQAVLQMADKDFSVVCFRQGTVSGFSPRMRLDLVVNTMFKSVMSTRGITVNNPAIWRPILSIEDAVSAYIRAIEANEEISGIFNVASGNYTLGEIGDIVRTALGRHLNAEVGLTIKHMHDLRNYKVSFEKAENVLSFKPRHGVESIINHLVKNLDRFKDFDNPRYYNIEVFKKVGA